MSDTVSSAGAKVESASSDAASDNAPSSSSTEKNKSITETCERRIGLKQDQEMVVRLQKGDERAFREMVTTYQDRIFGLTFRMMGNRQEAEDLAQEVFLTVHRAIGNYRGEGRLYTWMYRIASNTCKNRLKYLKGRNFHRSDDLEKSPSAQQPEQNSGPNMRLHSEVHDPETLLHGDRLEKLIQRELANLETDHRLLIVLRDIQGMSYHDIVRITGLPEGTLKSRLHRARVALKKRISFAL